MTQEIDISGCIHENLTSSPVLLIVFSCLDDNRRENGKFDFFFLARQHDFDVVLVRDVQNTWFQMPVEGEPDSRAALLGHLSRLLPHYERVVCLGHSMGGYAAILFGRLMGVDRVLALAPQTDLTPEYARTIKDDRYTERLIRLRDLPLPLFFSDLAQVPYGARVQTTIYIAGEDRLDREHALRLAGQPGVTIVPLDGVGHGLSQPLMKSGALMEMIRISAYTGEVYSPQPRLDALREQFRHKIAFAPDFHTNDLTDRLSATVVFTNIGDQVWTEATHPGVNLLGRVYDLSTAKELHFTAIPMIDGQIAPGAAVERTITVDLSDYPVGRYELQVICDVHDMSSYELGYRPIGLSFEIARTLLPRFIHRAYTQYRPAVKVAEEHFGATAWDTATVEEMHFPVTPGRLETRNGRVVRDAIVIDAKYDDFGVFGPFIALEPGEYEAVFDYDDENTEGEAHLDVVDVPDRTFAALPLSFAAGNAQPALGIRFTLVEPVGRLEVRLFCKAGFRSIIRSLTIRNLAGAQTARALEMVLPS
jgi:hypothetical protein